MGANRSMALFSPAAVMASSTFSKLQGNTRHTSKTQTKTSCKSYAYSVDLFILYFSMDLSEHMEIRMQNWRNGTLPFQHCYIDIAQLE